MSRVQPTLQRALLLPLLFALALAALVFRSPSAPAVPARPPLPLPVSFDELAPSNGAVVVEPGPTQANAEGLRSLRAP